MSVGFLCKILELMPLVSVMLPPTSGWICRSLEGSLINSLILLILFTFFPLSYDKDDSFNFMAA
jgi:hypothetical protein